MGKRGALLCESEGTSTNLEVEAVSSIFVFFCMQVVEQISEILFASIIYYCLTLAFAGRLPVVFPRCWHEYRLYFFTDAALYRYIF